MNEQEARNVLAILANDDVSDAEYEHVQRTLLERNHAEFVVSTEHRRVEYLRGRLTVSDGAVIQWPRCARCRSTADNPRFRGALGRRLCSRCSYAEERQHNAKHERQRAERLRIYRAPGRG